MSEIIRTFDSYLIAKKNQCVIKANLFAEVADVSSFFRVENSLVRV